MSGWGEHPDHHDQQGAEYLTRILAQGSFARVSQTPETPKQFFIRVVHGKDKADHKKPPTLVACTYPDTDGRLAVARIFALFARCALFMHRLPALAACPE